MLHAAPLNPLPLTPAALLLPRPRSSFRDPMMRCFVILALLGCALAAAPTDDLDLETKLHQRAGQSALATALDLRASLEGKAHSHNPHSHNPHSHSTNAHEVANPMDYGGGGGDNPELPASKLALEFPALF